MAGRGLPADVLGDCFLSRRDLEVLGIGVVWLRGVGRFGGRGNCC